MRKYILLLLIAPILLSGCTNKSELQIYKNIESLTSVEMDGRLTGTEGNKRAVEYIVKEFQGMGLEPLKQNTYLLDYPHKFYNPNNRYFQLSIVSKQDEVTELQRGVDYLERSGFTNYHAKSPYTFDINHPDLENRFIVLKDNTNYRQAIEQAKGLLIVEDAFRRTILVDSLEKPIIQITKEVYDQLKKTVNAQIEVKSSTYQNTIKAYNVVGTIPGKDNTKAVVLSAHFDHVGSIRDQVYHGAIDNASGVSVLLDVAEKLIQSDSQFEKDIIIVAFNGEESGLQGSQYFANYIKNQYNEIFNINIDSLYDGPIQLVSYKEAGDLIKDLEISFKNNGVVTKTDNSGSLDSDHVSFLNNGINAVSVISQNIMTKIHQSENHIEEINIPFLYQVSESLFQFLIQYDEKSYKIKYPNIASNNNISLEEKHEIREKALEELRYNEYKLIDYKNYSMLITQQSYKFSDIHEFKKYYPDVQIPINLGNFKLKSIVVSNQFSDPIDPSKLELNKVYTRKINPKDLQYIRLEYHLLNNPNQIFDIAIDKTKHINEEQSIIKKLRMNNTTFNLTYDLKQEHLYNFSFKEELENQQYTISITRGEKLKVDTFKTTLTEEEVRNIIKNYQVVEVASEILKTLHVTWK